MTTNREDFSGVACTATSRSSHSTSWRAGCPSCVADCPETLAKRGDGFGALDPTNNATFSAVEAVLTELPKKQGVDVKTPLAGAPQV